MAIDVLDFIADIDRFNLAGRYPDALTSNPSSEEGRTVLDRSSEVLKWLNSQFSQ